jgi:signal transduction histidine kinase
VRLSRRASLRLRDQLLLSHLGLAILAMVLSGLFVLNQMEQFYLAQLQAQLTIEADLLADRATESLISGFYLPLQAALAALDRRSAVRVRVIDADGRLVAATEAVDLPRLGQHIAAPGLDEGLRGQHSVVRDDTVPTGEVLYLVAPVLEGGRVLGAVRLAYALEDVTAEVSALRRALILGLAGVTALALLLAQLLAANLAAPARRLGDAARRLAAGNLGTRCGASGPAEIAAAGRAFDEMASRLQDLQQERERLLAAVAHDLHAASMGIGTALDALEHGAADDPMLRDDLLQGMEGYTRRLARLADDLLQTARLETSTFHLETRPIAPAALLQQAAAEFRADAAARGVTLTIDAAPALPPIVVDPARLGQALANLLENALRHSPGGSTVRLEARREQATIVLAVADEGPGYPPDPGVAAAPAEPGAAAAPVLDQPAPREPAAERTPGDSDRRPGRLGLGLSIVRGIAEAHGGQLRVDGRAGQGARFAIVLPAAVGLAPELVSAEAPGGS